MRAPRTAPTSPTRSSAPGTSTSSSSAAGSATSTCAGTTLRRPCSGGDCAVTLRDRLADVGLEIRAGIHVGDVERRGDDITGLAVNIAARIAAAAHGSEVLVTRTVADLIAGSGIALADRGEAQRRACPAPGDCSASSPREPAPVPARAGPLAARPAERIGLRPGRPSTASHVLVPPRGPATTAQPHVAAVTSTSHPALPNLLRWGIGSRSTSSTVRGTAYGGHCVSAERSSASAGRRRGQCAAANRAVRAVAGAGHHPPTSRCPGRVGA